MASKAERIAASLTRPQRDALIAARDIDGDLHVPVRTHAAVRRRLYELGLLSSRPASPLNPLGRVVREILLKEKACG